MSSPSIKRPTPPASQATLDLVATFEARGWEFYPVQWTAGQGDDTPPLQYWLYKAPDMDTQGMTDTIDLTEEQLLLAHARFMVRQTYGARLGIEFARQQAILIDTLAAMAPELDPASVTVPSFVVHLRDYPVPPPVSSTPTADPTH